MLELNKILEEVEEGHMKMKQDCQRLREQLREKDATEHKRILARVSQIRASAHNGTCVCTPYYARTVCEQIELHIHTRICFLLLQV